MEKLEFSTKRMLVKKSISGVAEAALICHRVGKVFKCFYDKDFLKEIEIVSVRDSKLYLKTTNSTIKQEIKIKENTILEKINTELDGSQNIKKISFKI